MTKQKKINRIGDTLEVSILGICVNEAYLDRYVRPYGVADATAKKFIAVCVVKRWEN